MRVFLTGASGYIGSAVARAFVQAGHQVVGLARNPERARVVAAMGVEPIVGDLVDPTLLVEAVRDRDAVVHCAFQYGPGAVETDWRALEALIAGMGPGVLVATSGLWVVGATGDAPADEDSPVDHPAAMAAWRVGHERLVLDAAGKQLVTAVVRPGIVYGGRGGIVGQVFDSVVQGGAAAFVGDGQNRWPLVHRDDLARLYVRIAEARAHGIFHGVDGHGARVADLARAASEVAGGGGRIRSIPLDEARRQVGPFADAVALDQVVVARRSAALGWEPTWGPFVREAGRAWEEWRAGT